jgi:hypothetical protein
LPTQNFQNEQFCKVVTSSFGIEYLSIPIGSFRAEHQMCAPVVFSHLASNSIALFALEAQK